MDTEIAGTFDGSYNKLIHQEDISGNELTLYSNQEQEQVSMSVLRPESSFKHYKRLTDTIMDISAEVAKLQAAYDAAIWHRDEAKKQLAREIREQQITKWELDHQKSRRMDYLKLSDNILMEIAALKSHIPMIKEGCRHCLPGWTFMHSVCYYFPFSDVFSPRSWQEARQFCINQGGDLAVIDSREKHLAITELITNYRVPSRPVAHSGFWIGLRDIEEEGIWKWIDGTRLTTGYWNDGEPNDYSVTVVSQQLMIDNVPKLRGGGMWWQNGFRIGLSDVATAGTWAQVNNVTEGETV
ncbi:hypothetical protein CgunFtcFv8_011658 [Champsocephalus gunnari]|uniref:C-type lectin domain-containing protein n=1 Tax=Champsocephalus gunnari TaxID=52237 RepID=A0AAN8HIL9_CHAGU|nr:hypothetical protein CgunFtcFv8_011658 [Champsocephalus gunnari]